LDSMEILSMALRRLPMVWPMSPSAPTSCLATSAVSSSDHPSDSSSPPTYTHTYTPHTHTTRRVGAQEPSVACQRSLRTPSQAFETELRRLRRKAVARGGAYLHQCMCGGALREPGRASHHTRRSYHHGSSSSGRRRWRPLARGSAGGSTELAWEDSGGGCDGGGVVIPYVASVVSTVHL
jgi:hypothetical protein